MYASLRDNKIFDLPKIYITRTGNPIKAFVDEKTYASIISSLYNLRIMILTQWIH